MEARPCAVSFAASLAILTWQAALDEGPWRVTFCRLSDPGGTGLMRGEIGVDIGGTFTDVVCRLDGGTVHIAKLPTTSGDPSRAVLAALQMAEREWGLAPADI